MGDADDEKQLVRNFLGRPILAAERDLQLLERVRAHTDLPFLVELLETHQRRSTRLNRPKHAAYMSEVIALISPGDAGRGEGGGHG